MARRWIWSSLGLGLAGIGGLGVRWWVKRSRFGPKSALRQGLARGLDEFGLALMQATGVQFVGGNLLEWKHDGSVFSAIEDEVARARHSVHIDIYIWKPGYPGDRLVELCCEKARGGIPVRILVDPLGSTDFDTAFLHRLRDAGCEVRYFRPFTKKPFAVMGRNHRKLVIVDGRVAFTGGFGFGPEWAHDGAHGPQWRDANVRVEGPVVKQMQLAFAAHWMETGGRHLPAEEFERCAPAGDAQACFVTSMDVKGLSAARWITHIALAAAEKRAWIANAYFIPPARIVASLSARTGDGVDVRLLLPGPHQDHPIVTFLQRRLYRRLDRDQVAVYEYQPSMMHSKTMLVDERLVVVGSINLDPASQGFLEEGSLIVDDRPFAAELEQRYLVDLSRSEQVTRLEKDSTNVRRFTLRPGSA